MLVRINCFISTINNLLPKGAQSISQKEDGASTSGWAGFGVSMIYLSPFRKRKRKKRQVAYRVVNLDCVLVESIIM